MSADRVSHNRSSLVLFAVCLLAGAVLRLSFPEDIEYKFDEQYMFEAGQKVGRSEPWPTVGMTSGASLKNPPLSVWAFVALSRAFGVESPPSLARVVVCLNLAALLLFALFALYRLEPEWRSSWLMGLALLAVNPGAVQLQRKIWAQCLLPFFISLLFWAWSSRRRFPGAFCWGFLGALLGQIHMSGFFFAAALFGWTLLFDARRKEIAWAGWFAGSIAGALPLIPWLLAIRSGESGGASGFHAVEALFFRFYLYAFAQPFGLVDLRQSLGKESFAKFLSAPSGLYLVGALHLVFILALAVALLLGVRFIYERRSSLRALLTKAPSEGTLLLGAVMLGYGLLLSASTLRIFRHYLIIALPLPFVLAAAMLGLKRWGRWIVFTLAAAQLIVSAAFLSFIHHEGGAPSGDYGVSYRAQQK